MITLISGFTTDTALLTADQDNDRLVLSYEMLLGTSDQLVDSDRDGLTDHEEFLAGTDGTDSDSSMRFDGGIEQKGQTLTLRLQTVVGKRYQLLFCKTVTDVGTPVIEPVTAESPITELEISMPAEPTGFFTVQLMD